MRIKAPKLVVKPIVKKPKFKSEEPITQKTSYYFKGDGHCNIINNTNNMPDSPEIDVKEYTFLIGITFWLLGLVLFIVSVPGKGNTPSMDGCHTTFSAHNNNRWSRFVIWCLHIVRKDLVLKGVIDISINYTTGDIKVDTDKDGVLAYVDQPSWIDGKIKKTELLGWSSKVSMVNTVREQKAGE